MCFKHLGTRDGTWPDLSIPLTHSKLEINSSLTWVLFDPMRFFLTRRAKNWKLGFLGEIFQTQTKIGWPGSEFFDPDPSLLGTNNLHPNDVPFYLMYLKLTQKQQFFLWQVYNFENTWSVPTKLLHFVLDNIRKN